MFDATSISAPFSVIDLQKLTEISDIYMFFTKAQDKSGKKGESGDAPQNRRFPTFTAFRSPKRRENYRRHVRGSHG